MLKASYINKGAASKTHDVQSGKCFYEVICGTFEMHGTEGRAAGYICNINRPTTSKSLIGRGRECKKGGTMTGSRVPNPRASSRAQNQPLGADRTPNVESEEMVFNAEISVPSIEHGSPAVEKNTTTLINDTLGGSNGGAGTANPADKQGSPSNDDDRRTAIRIRGCFKKGAFSSGSRCLQRHR